ncbi:MAG: MmgE/PrpD family protein [Burkholderiales bacterium]
MAAFIAASRTASLPQPVSDAARRAFVNWMGCALGAVDDASVRQVKQVALQLSARAESSIVGHEETLDPVNAALVNGVAANALDYDDMHAPTLIHPTGPVVAAALALGEARSCSGAVLVAAIVAGIEVECRIGLALFPAHYDAGWHITATLGTLGAAAAACVAIGLDEPRTRHALGIASTQAGGLRAMLTNACKSLNIGKAAAAGVTSALLAEAGFESDPSALESKFGFFHAFGQPRDGAAFTRDPDSRYLVLDASLKPYPCGIVIHPTIDACVALATEHELRAERVRRVHITVQPRAKELADRQRPATAIEGRYSLQHAAALAFTRRSAGLADFDGAPVDDPQLTAWRDRMALATDPAMRPSEARVVVELVDGRSVVHSVTQPSGSPERPLTDAQLQRKFMELATRAVEHGAAERLYTHCRNVDQLDDVNALRRHWTAVATSQ